MYRLIKLEEANDLRDFMNLACKCKNDVGVHTDENQIADAKSILGVLGMAVRKKAKLTIYGEKNMDEVAKELKRYAA